MPTGEQRRVTGPSAMFRALTQRYRLFAVWFSWLGIFLAPWTSLFFHTRVLRCRRDPFCVLNGKKVTFFELRPEFLNVLEFHWVPFAGVWTVVDIDRTHIDVLLMSTGPDAPDLEVKLRERAAWHLLVHVAQQVELLFVSQESPVHSLIDVVEQQAI